MMISVIGGERCSQAALEAAEAVGRELAKRGVTIVCGGRGGVMEAACRGARSAGGHTIGILPGRGPGESHPNGYVEFPIYTGMGFARNVMVVLSGEAVVAVSGSYGTLSEIAYALIHDIPVIGLDTWDFKYAGHDGEKIIRCDDPVTAAVTAIERASKRQHPSRGSHAEQ
ncbi:MAG TPA: TIGR00725 family protein [Dehalococcoidia bacterium]|nr:TIGR00725 family protein [Dehalococcoidia bacterium]